MFDSTVKTNQSSQNSLTKSEESILSRDNMGILVPVYRRILFPPKKSSKQSSHSLGSLQPSPQCHVSFFGIVSFLSTQASNGIFTKGGYLLSSLSFNCLFNMNLTGSWQECIRFANSDICTRVKKENVGADVTSRPPSLYNSMVKSNILIITQMPEQHLVTWTIEEGAGERFGAELEFVMPEMHLILLTLFQKS